jgi:hypothetical protein
MNKNYELLTILKLTILYFLTNYKFILIKIQTSFCQFLQILKYI